MKSSCRRLLKGLAVVVLLLLFLIAGMPLWFPWALRPALQRFGIHYGEYERAGYGSFALVDVAFTNRSTRFTAHRVQTFVPTTWFWHHLLRHTDHDFVRIIDWQLEYKSFGTKATNEVESPSIYAVLEQAQRRLPKIRNWLPRATVTGGVIRSGATEIELPSAQWRDGLLRADAALSRVQQHAVFEVNLTSIDSWQVGVRFQPLELEATARIARHSDSAQISGTIVWRTNRLEFQSQFPRQGWLPSDASAGAPSFRIPASDLHLPGYADVTGSLSVQWRQQMLAADVTAQAEPLNGNSPRVAVSVRGTGNTNILRIDQFHVSTPFLNARLSPGTELSLAGELLSVKSTLQFNANLEEQAWLPASGILRGEIQLTPGLRKYPNATFQIAATELTSHGVRIDEMICRGGISWPQLELQQLSFRVATNVSVQTAATVNLQSRFLSHANVQLSAAKGLNYLDFSFDRFAFAAELSGPLNDLTHSAQLELLNLRSPKVNPLTITATSRGHQLQFDELHAQFTAPPGTVQVRGAARLATNELEIKLATLTLVRGEKGLLSLREPTEFKASRLASATNQAAWQVHCPGLDLGGDGGQLRLNAIIHWPPEGNISLSASAISGDLLRDFFQRPAFPISVQRLALVGGWTNAPAIFNLDLQAQLTSTNALPFSGEIKAAGKPDGLLLDRLVVSDQSNVVFMSTGFLPVTVNPARAGQLV